MCISRGHVFLCLFASQGMAIESHNIIPINVVISRLILLWKNRILCDIYNWEIFCFEMKKSIRKFFPKVFHHFVFIRKYNVDKNKFRFADISSQIYHFRKSRVRYAVNCRFSTIRVEKKLYVFFCITVLILSSHKNFSVRISKCKNDFHREQFNYKRFIQ